MKVIVVYDIPVECEKLRKEVREYLKNFGGIFVEYSVYFLDIEERDFKILVNGLRKLLKKCGGRVDIIRPCKRCFSGIKIIDTTKL